MTEFNKKLWNWGLREGVITGATAESVYNALNEKTREFVDRELKSRVYGVKALKWLNPTLRIKQMYLYSKYDFEYTSGGTVEHTEVKRRDFPSGQYPDYMLSMDKATESDFNINYLTVLSDNVFYLWDLRKCPRHTRKNTHNRYTAVPSEKITKEELFFFPEDAEFTGKYE